ncbi:MAG: hypothetical protein H6819_03440 [Phycisphaerales bacterium]|nr:hypothetical protein [Phycisphaerales bacterium]MCB9856250.1 hypothetical protein [Phycisphaerales bacterium]MCB9863311.1 hypothetical protein [Phycisphaerales bacterium]
MKKRVDLDKLIASLKSQKSSVRERAEMQLLDVAPGKADLPTLYRAIRDDYPGQEENDYDVKGTLLGMLGPIGDARTVAFIEDVFPSLPKAGGLRDLALGALAEMNTATALALWADLLLRHHRGLGAKYQPSVDPIIVSPRHVSVMFPRILAILGHAGCREAIYELAGAGVAAGRIDGARLVKLRSRIAGDFETASRLLKKTSVNSHLYPRRLAYVTSIVQTFGAFAQRGDVRNQLRRIRGHDVASVAFVACRICDASGDSLDGAMVERFATEPSTRLDLFEHLVKSRREKLFPAAWQSQPMFAEADMVRCLMARNAFGRPPVGLKYDGQRMVNVLGAKRRLYFYTFKSDVSPSERVLGMSGPHPADERELITRGLLSGTGGEPKRDCGEDRYIWMLRRDVERLSREAKASGKVLKLWPRTYRARK